MARPITLFTGQWADLPFEKVAELAAGWGYDGLEIACWGDHLDVWRAAEEPDYLASRKEILDRYGLQVFAISNHLKGQAVCDDPIDARHRGMLPDRIWGDGEAEGVRQRAAEEMKLTAKAARGLGVDVVVGFTGSSIWKYVAMFPPVSQDLVDAGYQDFADRWNPILDVFDDEGVKFAHEVHPSEIAYDYWTTVATMEAIGHREAFGLNWDPSHFVWQDLDPVGFMWDFKDRIYHVDCKDAKRRVGNGRNGRLGSHLAWADPRRGWDFVSTGHGDVPVGGLLPDDEHHRLHRTHLGGVGGRRDGPAGRRARGARVRQVTGVRPAIGSLRRRVRRRLGRLRRRPGPGQPVDHLGQQLRVGLGEPGDGGEVDAVADQPDDLLGHRVGDGAAQRVLPAAERVDQQLAGLRVGPLAVVHGGDQRHPEGVLLLGRHRVLQERPHRLLPLQPLGHVGRHPLADLGEHAEEQRVFDGKW